MKAATLRAVALLLLIVATPILSSIVTVPTASYILNILDSKHSADPFGTTIFQMVLFLTVSITLISFTYSTFIDSNYEILYPSKYLWTSVYLLSLLTLFFLDASLYSSDVTRPRFYVYASFLFVISGIYLLSIISRRLWTYLRCGSRQISIG